VFGVTAASRNARFQAARYGLTWVGLAPTDRASFAWRLPSFAGSGSDAESEYGYLFVAFRPDLIGSADAFERQVTQLIERIRATPRRPGVDDISIPSERAFHSRERALREGLEIDRAVFDALVALRARKG
jgi:LDH2 family malate/lactate/ureidoglycolate dehydrogenase